MPNIFSAIEQKNLELVSTLMVDPNARNEQFLPLLHKAISSSSIAIIEFLLDNGADINILDSCNRTPLEKAIMLGYPSKVLLLISRGAEINGVAPLKMAIESKNTNIVKILIENGVNIMNSNYLEIAIKSGCFDIVKILIENGVNIMNSNYLEMAIKACNSLDIVKYLIEVGIDTTNLNYVKMAVEYESAFPLRGKASRATLGTQQNWARRTQFGNDPFHIYNNKREIIEILKEATERSNL